MTYSYSYQKDQAWHVCNSLCRYCDKCCDAGAGLWFYLKLIRQRSKRDKQYPEQETG